MIPNSNTHISITIEGNGVRAAKYPHFNLWDDQRSVCAADVVSEVPVEFIASVSRESDSNDDDNQADGGCKPASPIPLDLNQNVLEVLDSWSTKPGWVKGYRDHQVDAVGSCLDAYNRGVKVVILDAPTGSGKTLIGEMVRVAMGVKALYVCSGKQLQDQFLADFGYAKVLKGRGNYATVSQPFPEYTAADCNDTCHYCPSKAVCHYQVAKQQARESELAVLNTTYLLNEANNTESVFSGRSLGIIDECDMLEDELMRFVEFRISEAMMRDLGIGPLKKSVHRATIKEWLDTDLIPCIDMAVDALKGSKSDEMLKKKKTYERLSMQAHRVAAKVEDENWIRDYESKGFGDRKQELDSFIMRPVTVEGDGQWALWRHAQRWLVMSATIISAEQFARDLGLKEEEWEVVTVPMTFPVANRPVVVKGVANMTYKTEVEERPKLARMLVKIIDLHGDDNVLVHTNSYKLTEWLYNEITSSRGVKNPKRILHYLSGRDRDRVLRQFRSKGGVLLGPSLDRGIDLPGNLCRVMVVAKCPYPSLGDKQVSTRLHLPGGQTWFGVKTVRTIVQMTGRGVRNSEDHAVTYILDSQFSKNIYKKNKSLFPEYWREALDVGINSEFARDLRR